MSKPSIDPDALRLFAEISEIGSLSQAAVQMGTAQSFLSRKISALEAELGRPLFVRTGRGLALTGFGRAILPHIKEWHDRTIQLVDTVISQSGVMMGEVRIGILSATATPLMSTFLHEMYKGMPRIKLVLLEGNVRQVESWIATGQVDLGLSLLYGSPQENEGVLLAEFDVYLCAREDDESIPRDEIDFSDLASLPLVLPGKPHGLRTYIDDLGAQAGMAIQSAMDVDSLSIQRDLVARGDVYALLSRNAIVNAWGAERFRCVRVINPAIVQRLVLQTTQYGPLTEVIRSVSDELKRCAARLVSAGVLKRCF